MTDSDLLEQLRLDPNQRAGGGARYRWRWLFGLLLLAVAAGGAAWFWLQGRALPVDVVTAEAMTGTDAPIPVLEATGYVTARREATVSSKSTGKLAAMLVEEGDQVKAGQVLARLDDSDTRAQLGLARAQVAAAQAQLGSLEAELDQARRDLTRQQDLSNRGLTSAQALDDAHTKVATLTARIGAQRSQIAVTEAQRHIAQVNEDDTVIRAPFAGVVVNKAAQVGEIVSPMSAGGGFTRTGICTLVDMDSLEIEVDVNEAYINRVKPGQPAQAVLDAYPDWKIPARVIAIIPTADRSKATVKVRVAIDAKDPRILPDMGVRVAFLEPPADPSQTARGVLVPATAIVQRGGTSVVFVVNGGRAHRHTVTPGQSYTDRRLIEHGLQAGATVVKDPPPTLTDGMRVAARSGNA